MAGRMPHHLIQELIQVSGGALEESSKSGVPSEGPNDRRV